jgi:hypothetical protein
VEDEALQKTLKELGVYWAKQVDPELEKLPDGRYRLLVCTSFSYDPGYSMYHVGEGATLEECVANLHDDPRLDC